MSPARIAVRSMIARPNDRKCRNTSQRRLTYAQWLTQVRVNARSVPVEARLTRGAAPTGATWTGTLVMSLPPR